MPVEAEEGATHLELSFCVWTFESTHLSVIKNIVPVVNTENWYRKGTDLWAEFGNEMPFGRKNLLR
jgi:hypothetical protein